VDKIYKEQPVYQTALDLHKKYQGKIGINCKMPVRNREDLALAYSPGVARPCLEIEEQPETIYDYTAKGNMVAVVTNGTAVLGLGNIGAAAGLPVMEGKAILFKSFADIDAFPICIDSLDSDEIIRTVKLIRASFGAINLEDIKAPECFYIEKKLIEQLDIPVFHDDQHGTAIVVLAGLLNALKLVDKNLGEVKIVANGSGAAGISIMKLLLHAGAKNIIACDRQGAVTKANAANPAQAELATLTNLDNRSGVLAEMLVGADVFIGVSAAGLVTTEMVRSMNSDSIVFALANPTPEIMPEEALAGGARVICTGRSDYPNQINNVLVFPGVFRGALDVRASRITTKMKVAAAHAIADSISVAELRDDYVIPGCFDERIAPAVAAAVADQAIKSGIAQILRNPEEIGKTTLARVANLRLQK
jgi:malate dehydrogenase (oxaloacetate-decarboxylating)